MPDFVTVHRTSSALEAEILGDVLVESGLDARVLGARAGAAPLSLAIEREARVDVPAADAGAARRIIAEHLEAARAASSSSPAEEDEPAAEGRLRPILAAGVVGVCPGGAHFYARRPLVGIAIAVGEMVSVVSLATSGDARFALVLCALLALDLAGGQLAVRAWNRGVRLTPPGQAFRGALVLAGAACVAIAGGPALERAAAPRRGRANAQKEMRGGAVDPRQLPFPLHLDFRR
jgi:hypothetical protein